MSKSHHRWKDKEAQGLQFQGFTSALTGLTAIRIPWQWEGDDSIIFFLKPLTGVFTFQVLQPKVLVQLRNDDVSFWHPGGTNWKISEQLFSDNPWMSNEHHFCFHLAHRCATFLCSWGDSLVGQLTSLHLNVFAQHCQIILSMAVKYDPFTSMINPELE